MIYLGTSGWYYKDWIGRFYPKDIKQNEWLTFYSKKFSTVEVNASFYRLPFKNMLKAWNNKTPDDFLLTFKGSRLITHNKKLIDIDEYLKEFYERISLVEKKIGIILWQLPPQLKKDLNLLENFLEKLDSRFRQCIEFRHESWFNNEVYRLLKKYNVAICIISAPNIKTEIKLTTDFAYIRWHGKGNDWYKYNYSKEELNKWANGIKKLDVKDVYGYFNNDYDAFAVENCMKLKEIINLSY